MYDQIVKEANKNALELVRLERERQIAKFDYDHDDGHAGGELIVVANLIAMDVQAQDDDCIGDDDDEDWMHELALKVRKKYGKMYKRRLVIAAAMLLAEIERRERIDLLEALPE